MFHKINIPGGVLWNNIYFNGCPRNSRYSFCSIRRCESDFVPGTIPSARFLSYPLIPKTLQALLTLTSQKDFVFGFCEAPNGLDCFWQQKGSRLPSCLCSWTFLLSAEVGKVGSASFLIPFFFFLSPFSLLKEKFILWKNRPLLSLIQFFTSHYTM